MANKLDYFCNLVQDEEKLIAYPLQNEQKGYLCYHPDLVQTVLSNKQRNYLEAGHPFRELFDDFSEAGKHILLLKKARDAYKLSLLETSIPYAEELVKEISKTKEGIDFYRMCKILILRIVTDSLFDFKLNAEKADCFVTATETLEGFVMERRARDETYFVQRDGLHDICREILAVTRPNELPDEKTVNAVMRTLLNAYNGPATCLAWAIYELAMQPTALQKLQKEAEIALPKLKNGKLNALATSRYAAALVLETLRLYPPAWLLARSSSSTHELAGLTIPKDAEITLCSYLTHRHPQFWDKPTTFFPQRFLDGAPKHPFAFFPFGNGALTCPARSYSIQLIQILLLFVGGSLEVERWRDSEPLGLISLRPSPKMRLNFTTISSKGD